MANKPNQRVIIEEGALKKSLNPPPTSQRPPPPRPQTPPAPSAATQSQPPKPSNG